MLYKGRLLPLAVPLKYQQGRVLFKKPKGCRDLAILNFKGSKFTVFNTILPEGEEECSLISSS